MNQRTLLLGLLLVAPVPGLAEQPPQYLGVTVGEHELTDTNGNITETTNIGLRGGYKFNDFLGAELRGGWESGGVSGALDSPDTLYAGAFARLDLPFRKTNVFLLLGGAGVEYDLGATSESESDIAGGIGIELFGNERTGVTLEYMNYADGTYEGVSIGLVHHFNWPSFR